MPYTREQVYTMLFAACQAEVAFRQREFSGTDAFKKHLWDISRWITADNASFGLFLCGDKGNGKTTIMRALHNLYGWIYRDEYSSDTGRAGATIQGFEVVTAKELVRLAKAFANPTRENDDDNRHYRRLRNIRILAIDDLGTEPSQSMTYGDFVNASADMISYRYDNRLCTIATSNLAPEQIKDHYDERFADRFREMMTVINFRSEPSFRTPAAVS